MHSYKKYFLFLIVLCGWMWQLSAQSGKPGQNRFVVEGIVMKEEGEQKLEYASIIVHQLPDSSIQGGSVSDSEGRFEVRLPAGEYYLEIGYLSFEKNYTKPFRLNKENPVFSLGEIYLSESGLTLETVEISAEKSMVRLELDKRIYEVGADLSNVGSNAAEILDNVPSVTVDIEGNVSLRGSENVRILIDGKPSGLVGISSTDALRNMQGSMIERVEVITNPSARYDAEGEVGIINIVLKKNKKKGVNGSFNLGVGYPARHNAAYNLNFRKKKLNLFSSFGINYRNGPGNGYSIQEYNGDTLYNSFQTQRQHMRQEIGGNFRAGLDYQLNEFNTITASGLYKYSTGENVSNVQYLDLNPEGLEISRADRDNIETEIENNAEASLSWRKTYKQKDREWTSDVKYIRSTEQELADYWEQVQGDPDAQIQRSSNIEDEVRWLVQSDYIHPIGKKGKFETGMRANLRSIRNDYLVEDQLENGEYVPDEEFDNLLVYTENIYAAYAIYGNTFKKFSYQGGLRVEHSDINTELLETGFENPRRYTNFFPSVHLSYETDTKNQFQLSYSRRISRPRFRHLLPFYGFTDNRNFYSGNPDLNPEYTDSYELGYLKFWEKGSLLSSVYYRHRTGVIERVVDVDENGWTRRFPINLAVQNAFGLEFNGNIDIKEWWSLTGNANFYRAITDGEYNGQRFYADTYTWTSRMSTKLKLPHKINVQSSFNYRAPRITPQGRTLAIYSWDMGISKEILKGKGTLSFSGRDLLNSRKRRSFVENDNFTFYSEFQWRQRQFTLSFNYRLNESKRRGGRGRGGRDGNGGGDFDGGDF